MTATEELLPCPFCGGEASIKEYDRFEDESKVYFAWCYDNDCMIEPMSRGFEEKDAAIKAWNTRAMLGNGTCEMYRDDFGDWHCMACENGADTITGSSGILYSWNDSWAPNYCPNCGRKVINND